MHQRPIVVSLAALREQAIYRPEGYMADVLSRGRLVGEVLELSPAAHAALVAKYQRIKPAESWPFWALVAALFATAEDAGVGDTIARTLGGARSEGFKRHHEAVFGVWAKPCGCAGQAARWNALYPYQIAA